MLPRIPSSTTFEIKVFSKTHTVMMTFMAIAMLVIMVTLNNLTLPSVEMLPAVAFDHVPAQAKVVFRCPITLAAL